MHRVDCVIVGAGVIGLAAARALAARGREVLILEAAKSFGQGISSRNSEVIHAGIYYPRGSLKADLCVRGRRLLYAYCASAGIAYRRCGKLIVATGAAQHDALLALWRRGLDNAVEDLVPLEAAQALRLEPELRCTLALLSASTGIVDSHAFMLSLLGDAERDGATIAYRCPVTAGRTSSAGIVLAVGGAAPTEIAARTVINCAGLGAQRLAEGIEGIAREAIPPLHLAKGNYFALSGRAPFSRLIYPVPQPGGLGVHLTLDLAGQARFGPDVEWIDEENYDVARARADAFYAAIRRYWPALRDGTLNPAYAGIRPKLRGAGGGDADFVIQGAARHGVPGLINLFGIESPGLTAALALGDMIAELADSRRDGVPS